MRKEKTTPLLVAKLMRNINEVILSGNLIKDPTVRKTDKNTFADFTVGSNRKAYQVDGEWKQGADFIPVSAAGKAAERIAELPKGSSIVFRGSLESYNYEKEDKTVYGLRVHLAEIISATKKDA